MKYRNRFASFIIMLCIILQLFLITVQSEDTKDIDNSNSVIGELSDNDIVTEPIAPPPDAELFLFDKVDMVYLVNYYFEVI